MNNVKRTHRLFVTLSLALLFSLLAVGVALAAVGNIDATNKWAWGANVGWVNFAPDNGGVTVYSDHLEGYAWGENIGWIKLGTCTGGSPCTHANTTAANYGVNNDGAGNLSGYAWGANVGWINFDPDGSEQVTINPATGDFAGYAWAENVGWIKVSGAANNSAPYKVNTAWNATSPTCYATPNSGATVFTSLDAHAVQQAVDAASPGGHVKVAGVCVGVESRASTNQSTYISKTLTLSGGYTNTLASWTGAGDPLANPTVIDANQSGRVLFATAALTVSNITLQRGDIGGSGTACPSAGCGGGIYAANLLSLSNVQVLSNTARYTGGGVLTSGATTAMNSRFESNTSTNDGGGGLSTGSTLSLTNTEFLSNTALFSGGGAFANGATRAVDSRFENNRTRSVEGDGGGLRVNASLSLTNTYFVSNTARGQGGGAFASGAVTAVNSRFESNASTTNRGGGLFTAAALWLTNTHFLSNTSSSSGGGLHALGAATAVDSLFQNNTSLTSNGGGLRTDDTLSLTNTRFVNNTSAGTGGGVRASGATTVADSRFENNRSMNSDGGGLLTGSTLSLTNTQFISNTALNDGGGAVADSSTTAVNSLFQNNRATDDDGGGLWTGSLSLTNTHFLSNTAGSSGGAARASGSTTAVDSIFQNNQSGDRGGGLFAASTLNLSASFFLGNRAANEGGGAAVIHANDGASRIVNSLFARNSSGSGKGDAIFLIDTGNGGSVEVFFTSVSSPTLSSGAAIEAGAGKVAITDTIVTSHTFGIRETGSSAVSQDYNLFFGNAANTGGGTVDGGANSITGDPAFVNPAADDYRLTAASAAINIGADVGVYTDFEGDVRPQGGGFDAGYDESSFTATGSIVVQKVVVGQPPANAWQFVGPSGAFTLPAVGGSAVFTGVAAGGPYTIAETPQANYAAVSACSSGATGDASVDVTLGSGQTITCTFTNTRTIGLITIIKDSTPKSTQNFNFSAGPRVPLLNGGNEGGVLSAFMLDDAVPSDNDLYPKSRSFLLPNGVYNFSEAPPSNWYLKAIECTAGNGSSVVVTLPGVAITLGGGDVTCTFKNQLSATIQTLKYQDSNGNGVRNAGEPVLANWTITATLQPTGTALAPQVTNSLGRANFNFIMAGTYKVCEVLKPGWMNTQPVGEPCYTLTLTPGQTASVNFGNKPAPISSAEGSQELASLSPDAGVTIVDGDPDAFDGYAIDWAAWVDATLLTPAEEPVDGPAEEPGEADLTPRIYLPVVVK